MRTLRPLPGCARATRLAGEHAGRLRVALLRAYCIVRAEVTPVAGRYARAYRPEYVSVRAYPLLGALPPERQSLEGPMMMAINRGENHETQN